MGCIHAKDQSLDLHPNRYHVVNINDSGVDLCSGQLEVTDSNIILHREGRETTTWPLHSLRRYGFDAELFSFESGRRCETGEGIYAFRCRRAPVLFRVLQERIQMLNTMHDTPYPVSRLSSPLHGRQTLQATVVHRSSVDNGLPDIGQTINNNGDNIPPLLVPSNVNQSSRSPSSADILEVMPLYPRTQTTQASNIYQFRDFKKENNNNKMENNSGSSHDYCNDLKRDLAMLRNSLKEAAALNTMRDIEDETMMLEGRYMNEHLPVACSNPVNSLSPTLSSCSEHYAQLSMEQHEPAHLYVNITNSEFNKTDSQPNTPLTPKQINYSNISVGNKPELNSYANLTLGDAMDQTRIKNQDHTHKFSESDTITSLSPVEELEVNYAVLDIDTKKDDSKDVKAMRDLISPENQSLLSKNESSASCSTISKSGWLMSQSSMEKGAPPPGGYTTIDFEKTVALTSVASGSDSDCQRKTRHNSGNLLCGSPSSNEKIKLNI